MKIQEDLKLILKNDIETIKYYFNDIPIKVELINDEIFILINSIEISNSEKFEELIYNFKTTYIEEGYFNVFWGVDVSFDVDELELIFDSIFIDNYKLYNNLL